MLAREYSVLGCLLHERRRFRAHDARGLPHDAPLRQKSGHAHENSQEERTAFSAVKKPRPCGACSRRGVLYIDNGGAFRADMDAVCAKGGQPGHYCGHDGHSSILAGLALYLDKGKTELNRDVYFIFQPAEETGQGAKLCLPLLEEKKIGEIYGLHNIPGYPKNHILIKEGTFACASTGLEICMTGTPSHAAYPEAGKNPGFALAKLLLEVEKLTEQVNETGGFVRMTLIGMEIGSESYGVSASDGVLRLTVRGERECIFEEYVTAIKELAKERAKEENLTLAIHEIERFPATENHMDSVKKLRACAAKQGLPVTELKEPMRWSEDFGYYLQKTEGAFFGIGDGEDHVQLHTEQYEFPDEIIETAVRMFGGLV